MVRLVLCNVGNKIQVIKATYQLVRVRLHMGLFPNPILMGSLSIGPHFFIYSSNIIKDIKLQKWSNLLTSNVLDFIWYLISSIALSFPKTSYLISTFNNFVCFSISNLNLLILFISSKSIFKGFLWFLVSF